MKKAFKLILTAFILLGVWFCKPKNEIFTDDPSVKLSFSTDTVFFDTVFTSSGAIIAQNVTKRVRVFNTSDKAVNIAEIRLGGQNQSNYNIYVNGVNARTFNNTELLGKDSLYILVQLKIDDRNKDLPYIVEDTITFSTNGNFQKVRLLAWGQDAIYFKSDSIFANTNWVEGKPYVIFDHLNVKQGVTLNLAAGTKVVFGNKATMTVDGNIKSNGVFEKPVNFIQYRKGGRFDEVPGQWQGVVFSNRSANNTFEWTNVKNAVVGLDFRESGGQNSIKNCQILNMSDVAVSVAKSSVLLQNSLLTNAANYLLYAEGGGTIQVFNSTIVNSASDFFRSSPAILIDDKKAGNSWNVIFSNNIIWGNQNSELSIALPETAVPVIDYNLIKTNNSQFKNNNNIVNITSTNSIFTNASDRDFTLKKTSPAVNKAKIIVGVTDQPELNNKTRDAQPDMGAYEFIPE